jgi:hypothetical protein
MLFNPLHLYLERGVQGNALASQNKFMQVLPIARDYINPSANILCHEFIVEHDDARLRPRPGAILKYGCDATINIENDMRRLPSAQSVSVGDRRCGSRGQRTQNRRKGRLTSTVLTVDDREFRKRELGSSIDGIKLANIA